MTWGMVFGTILIIAATLVVGSIIVKLFQILIDYYVARRAKDLIAKLVKAEQRSEYLQHRYYCSINTAAEYKKKYEQMCDEFQRLRFETQRQQSNAYTRAAPPLAPQFSAEEIKRLVRLCHPDRHNNSEASVKMTQKLMSLRTL